MRKGGAFKEGVSGGRGFSVGPQCSGYSESTLLGHPDLALLAISVNRSMKVWVNSKGDRLVLLFAWDLLDRCDLSLIHVGSPLQRSLILI